MYIYIHTHSLNLTHLRAILGMVTFCHFRQASAFLLECWFLCLLGIVGLDLLRDGGTADRTLVQGFWAFLTGDQVSTGNEDDVNVAVHADFTELLPLEFLKFRHGVLWRKYVRNKHNIKTTSKSDSLPVSFVIFILFDFMKFESGQFPQCLACYF